MRRCLIGAALAFASGACVSAGTPPPLAAYGKLPAIDSVSLSPSGRLMVSVGDVDGKRYLLARTLTGDVKLAAPSPDALKIRNVRWVDDDHLLLSATGAALDFADLGRAEYGFSVNVNLPKKTAEPLFASDPRFPGFGYGVVANYVIGAKPYAFVASLSKEGASVGSHLISRDSGSYERFYPDLWRVDLTTGNADLVTRGTPEIDEWAVAPDGAVTGFSNYHALDSTWLLFQGDKLLMKRKSARDQTELDGLGRTADTMLVLDQSQGEDQWLQVGRDGATTRLWAGENVTTVLRNASTGLLVGAVIDHKRFEFFDPTWQAKVTAATRPFHGVVSVVATDEAVDKVIVHTTGAGDSGTYYLVDLTAGRADIIANNYPDVPADQVGEVKLVKYKASDGLGLDGVLTLPPGRKPQNLPVVVLPHGGPIGIEDDVEFDWMAQAFASRGYAVFQPNYRGSGGHGAALQNAGFGEWGRKMLSDISDGLSEIAREGVVDPKRACIVGFSYGGYAALAGVTVQQGLYRCAVSGSGISDVALFLNWIENRRGLGSATDKYLIEELGLKNPGAPSPASISPAHLAASADAPILLIHGTDDSVVPIAQSQVMADALKAAGKTVEFQTTKNEDHWLSKSSTRLETLTAAVAFVQKYNPAD
jgi:dipeptidyl aminopeptidase/acylaminoacyl peptidase